MSTRGTAYFEIQGSLNSDPVKVGRIGIPHDGYLSGFGFKVCDIISGIRIEKSTESTIEQQISRKCFRSIESVILYTLYRIPSDYYFDNEYIYRFIFDPYKNDNPSYYVEDVMAVEVKHKYADDDFSGTFEEFRALCRWPNG